MAELTKLAADLDIISLLDDEPNDVGGLSAEVFKAEFDKGTNIIKDYINETLLPELAGESGAENVGITTIPGVTGAENVQAALEKIESQLVDMTQGAVADGSINAAKLADAAVVAAKIANLAVTTAALADGSVTTPKLAELAVTAEKLANLAVTTAKIAAESVTREKIADGSINSAKLADAAVGTTQIDNASVTAAKLAAAAVETAKIANGAATWDKLAPNAAHKTATATLSQSGWSNSSQTVSVTGVTADNDFFCCAAPASFTVWNKAGIRPTAQGAGTITFTYTKAPTANVTVNVIIFK